MNDSGTSSKAVLAALRALQGKIQRLEAEKESAQDECRHLKSQIRSQEVESEHIKQRDVLNNQRSLLEAKAAFDRLSSENSGLERQLKELQERNSSSENTISGLKNQLNLLQEEKVDLLSNKHELDTKQRESYEKLTLFQQKEQELSSKYVHEVKKFEGDISIFQSRLKSADDELERLQLEKVSNANKLAELDTVVAQLLKINESLVSQLQGKYTPGITVKIKNKKNVARKINCESSMYNSRRSSRRSSGSGNGSSSIKRNSTFKKKSTNAVSSSSSSSSRLKSSRSSATGTYKNTIKNRENKTVSSDSGNNPGISDAPSFINSYVDNADYGYSGSDSNNSSHPSGGPELQSTIADLETEFTELQSQYSTLINDIVQEDDIRNGNSGSGSSKDLASSCPTTMKSRMDLINVLQRMQGNGEQLRQLKSPK